MDSKLKLVTSNDGGAIRRPVGHGQRLIGNHLAKITASEIIKRHERDRDLVLKVALFRDRRRIDKVKLTFKIFHTSPFAGEEFAQHRERVLVRRIADAVGVRGVFDDSDQLHDVVFALTVWSDRYPMKLTALPATDAEVKMFEEAASSRWADRRYFPGNGGGTAA